MVSTLAFAQIVTQDRGSSFCPRHLLAHISSCVTTHWQLEQPYALGYVCVPGIIISNASFSPSSVPFWTRNYMGSIHRPLMPSVLHCEGDVVKLPLYQKIWPWVLAFLFTQVLTGHVLVSSLQPRSSGSHYHFRSYRYDLPAGLAVVLCVRTENSLEPSPPLLLC